MTAPPDPPRSDGPSAAPTDEPAPVASERRRPWAWIAVCVVLVAVAGGFALWAVGLQADLDEQQDKTTQAQQEAEAANQQAQEASDAVGALAAQLDQVAQGLEDAGDQLAQAGDDAEENAQTAVDGLKGQVAALKDQVTQAGERPSATPVPAEATGTP